MKSLLVSVVALLSISSAAIAQPISNAEYAMLSAKYVARLPVNLATNQVAYDHNVNPLANGGLERLDSPYDLSDAFFCKNGFVCPGWYGMVGGGGGGTGDGGGGAF